MTSRSRGDRHRQLLRSGLAAVFGCLLLPALAANAEDRGLLKTGDAVVSAFSGTKADADIPSDMHPIDRTFIDSDGAVLRILDLSKLGGAASGRMVDAPRKVFGKSGEIGQVFGVAVDRSGSVNAPDIFAAATSLFGLQIVSAEKSGELQRLVKGGPGARWMPGQFGLGKGGGPGTIWKIDGRSGTISRFADIKSDGKPNAGPGLGAIAIDPVTKQLFVADLESGLIHRLGMDGAERGTFDHGTAGRAALQLEAVVDAKRRMTIESPDFSVENPATWGYADKRRLVFGLAVANSRLYYSAAAGPEIWSVGITADGGFASDPRREIEISNGPSANLITGITFDGPNVIYLTQRGEAVGSYDYTAFAKPQQSAVLRYSWNDTDKAWSPAPEETPVGLKPPHRATAGGLALGYGYDSNGNLDTGKCRQTLWTTGDHLREGEDGTRIDHGGARVVSGLQGNGKMLARAEDATVVRSLSVTLALAGDPKTRALAIDQSPWASWFADLDGYFNDGGRDGHIGSVAIHDACDPKLETPSAPPIPSGPPPEFASGSPMPVPPLLPPFPPPGPVVINKVCAPGPIGGVIDCEITVENIGPVPLDAPVSFNDASIILAGPGAGGAVAITAATPDGPDWLCTPTPTAAFGCILPPASLLPGLVRSVDVKVDTGPLALAGNKGFRNCASLAAPWFGIACDEGATDIVVKKTGPAACLPGADCLFALTVTNNGALPYAGNLLLTDKMFVGGAAVAAPITSIVPVLGCGPDPVALPFSCAAPIVLAPGGSKAFALTVQMPAVPASYWAQNCFAASGAGVAPPVLPPVGPPGPAGAVSCVWVPVGAPPPLSNLRIEKTPLHAGKCGKSFPGPNIVCDYEVVIHNDGPSDFNNVIQFSETVPAAAVLSSIAAPWACAGGPPAYACVSPVTAIAAGGHITVPVKAKIPLAPLEAAGCTMVNMVAIMTPAGGTDQNFNAADDTAAAAADAFMSWLLPDGTTFVTCDPTNLIVKKTATGDCGKAGANYSCKYLVTVTNEGPDPFHGPIKFDEKFAIAPVSATFSAPWGCVPAGSSYQCTHPHVDMEMGDKVELVVTATVPETGACALKNTATMTFPLAGTRFNKDGSDDSASASANIPSPRCDRPVTPERCRDGKPVPRSGKCPVATETCLDGTPKPASGACPVPPVEEPCPEGKHRNGDGRCVADQTPCGKDQHRDDNGRCVDDQRETGCEDGSHRDRRTGKCVADDDQPRSCPPGTKRVGKGCVVIEAPRCPPGTIGTPPKCRPIEVKQCPKGTAGVWPNCKTVEPPKCPRGTAGTPPNCKTIEVKRCPVGTIGKYPNCKKIVLTCPEGMIGTPPNCKRPPVEQCPKGTFGKFPNCVKFEIPKKIDPAPSRAPALQKSGNLNRTFARSPAVR